MLRSKETERKGKKREEKEKKHENYIYDMNLASSKEVISCPSIGH